MTNNTLGHHSDAPTVEQVARELAVDLWTQAGTYLSTTAVMEAPWHESPDGLADCWRAAVWSQRFAGPALEDFQLPEPFAGYGGQTAQPRLLVIGTNPGYEPYQNTPTWSLRQSPNGWEQYFSRYWSAFSKRDASGRPMRHFRDGRNPDAIPHYANVEAALGMPKALSSVAWELDALPWKSLDGVSWLQNGRPPRTDRLVVPLGAAKHVAQTRAAKALTVICARPLDGDRRVLILGQTAAELLAAPWPGACPANWGWIRADRQTCLWAPPNTQLLVVSHPGSGWGGRAQERIRDLVAGVLTDHI